MKPKNKIPESKLRTVKELNELIKDKRVILLASIKNIPGSQFQEISKKIRGKAIVKVPKKNLIFRALDSSKNESVKKLKEHIGDSVAILFSDLDSFELAGELLRNTSPSKAKAGQEAPEDIEIEAGPTDFIPGPAISELGAMGIQIQIEKGKIHIKESKVIVRKGAKISSNASDLMNKLDIKPFSIGFIPLSAFDNKENKLYLEIKIDRKGEIEELKKLYSKALGFAIGVEYLSDDTIKLLIGKAGANERRLNKIITGEPEVSVVVSTETEIKKEEKEEVDTTAGLAGLFG